MLRIFSSFFSFYGFIISLMRLAWAADPGSKEKKCFMLRFAFKFKLRVVRAFKTTMEDLEDRRSVASVHSFQSLRSSYSLAGHRASEPFHMVDYHHSRSEDHGHGPSLLGLGSRGRAFTGDKHMLPAVPEVIPMLERADEGGPLGPPPPGTTSGRLGKSLTVDDPTFSSF
jgi:hypothetical protein